jgi:carbon starvation protein
MSSIGIAVIALVLLWAGYRFYSPRIARRLGLDLQQKTPAHTLYDGVDYVPARHWSVVFGHHFSSIAGAAPIIGPVIACLFWGWVPALLWIVIGGIFMGAVHDFSSLTMSLQNRGMSIATITESTLGKSGKLLFSIFVFLALILIVAVFAAVAGKTLADTPQVVVPTFGLIVVALIVGLMMYRLSLPLWLCSLTGIVLLGALIAAGYFFPVALPYADAARWWTVILLIYGLVASITPVHVLLQPRDHLAAAVLFLGLGLGFVGLVFTRPDIKAPALHAYHSARGAIWPMLFVTIACGAISGFHSLVASGTTSKQLPRMQDARKVGYGGMIMESALAVLAVIAVSAGLYWKSAPAGLAGVPVYQEVFKEGGWIKAFGAGYGEITKVLFGSVGMLIGITMLKTFVMTTLDSATRITRYMCSELFGDTLRIGVLKNKYVSTLFVGVLAGALALGNWKAIWPVFGASNQLIASLVLIVVSVSLVIRKKPYLFAAIPAALMLVTTIGALVYKTNEFFTASPPRVLLGTIAIVLMAMALFLVYKVITVIRAAGAGGRENTA